MCNDTWFENNLSMLILIITSYCGLMHIFIIQCCINAAFHKTSFLLNFIPLASFTFLHVT